MLPPWDFSVRYYRHDTQHDLDSLRNTHGTPFPAFTFAFKGSVCGGTVCPGTRCARTSRERCTAVEIANSGGGGNVLLAFLLGAVMIAVGIVGFFMWDNYKSHTGGGAPTATITVKGK